MTTGKIILILVAILLVALYWSVRLESAMLLLYDLFLVVLIFTIMLTHEKPTDQLRRWWPVKRGK